MPTVTLANGTRFEAAAGSTVLDAAEAAGVVLEHSCRTGRCGSCKARVLSGRAGPLRAASSLTAAEAAAGWILGCAHGAETELALDIEDLAALAGIRARTLPARIAALELLAPDVLRVELRLPPGAALRFRAGQSIELSGPGGLRRSYSIASDPARPERLELQIRRVPQGRLSAYWFGGAAVGDLLRFNGPRGTFYLRPLAGLHLVFLATGTGYAPVQSMLAELAALPAAEQPLSSTLFWGGRLPADLYRQPEAAPAQGAGPLPRSLHHVPVLSRADTAWAGARGHVQDVFLARQPELARTAVYACGSEAMVHAAQLALLAAGLPPRHFHFDAFVSSD
jgi:CDP-4-dehydro-6-deoxyglucose reductase